MVVGRSFFAFGSLLVFALTACGGDDKTSSSSGDPSSSGGSSSGGASSSGGSSSGGSSGTTPVGDGGSTTPPAPKSLKFVAMGDTGTGSDGQTKIGNTISAVCKARGCDFVQLLGDNLYDS